MLITTFLIYTLALLIAFNVKFYIDAKRSKKAIEIDGKKYALKIKAITAIRNNQKMQAA